MQTLKVRSLRLVNLKAWSCGLLAAASAPLDPKDFPAPIRVACVGDSITAGVGAPSGSAYPDQLRDLLKTGWEVKNFGVSGRTLLRKGDHPYWNENAFRDAKAFQPNVVIILLGANDTKPQNWKFVDEFAKDYGDLIAEFRNLPSKPRLYLGRPCPVPAPGNFGINEENVQKEIAIINGIAADQHLDIIDFHAVFESHADLLPDRVHPNADGYTLMAEAVYGTLTGKNPADIMTVASYFRSHAVLQRGVPVPVWGTGPDGAAVTVTFAGQTQKTTIAHHQWRVQLAPLAASATPATMTITGPTTTTIEDVLVGDVWLASGQSNMERQLGPRPPQKEILNWKEVAAAANYPLIRQFYVPQRFADKDAIDAKGRWSVCSPTTAPDFTAVGFFFAKELQPVINVPVGIIHSSWGGTCIETWISPTTIDTLGDAPKRDGKNQQAPSRLYHAMIAPLREVPITGVIWYQGESNNGRPAQYQTLMPALVADWRAFWKKPDMPFLYVQIAPYKSQSPEIREAQFLSLGKTTRTAMVVTADIGDANDIHPTNKAPVGARLALAARAIAYGEKLEYSGPLFQAAKADGATMVVSFTHLGGGLTVQGGGELKGFTIAGADKKFVPATARISGDTVIVSAPEITAPVAVRYGWANVPDVNLANQAGLPASPFRSDVP